MSCLVVSLLPSNTARCGFATSLDVKAGIYLNNMVRQIQVCLFVLCLIMSFGCKRQRPCIEPGLSYIFRGFDSSELLVVRQLRYEKGSRFQKLVSERIASSSVRNIRHGADTLSVEGLITSKDHDEIIQIPFAAGKKFMIRDISLGSETQTVGAFSAIDEQCALSCRLYLNDSLIQFSSGPPSNGFKYNEIVLVK